MAPPAGLWHRMSFQDAKGRQRTLQGAALTLAQKPAILIGPPLRGNRNWLVSEGPGNAHSHHWGSLLALNGVVTIPQRYAIDFVGLNARGHALEVSPDHLRDSANTAWFGYDTEVLAVADGVVRDARDGQPDGQPLSPHAEGDDLTARGLYGNFIVLEIAPGVFAHYAHLRPGSVRVRAGEHVHRGDVLAHLGDSGNSAAPHLHFHLSDKPVFEESEGLPFRFARFIDEGVAGEQVVLSSSAVWTPHPVECQETLPLDGAVIAFP
jgi:murein DD-endopeptidase MepM/ murein hydrolase activator NlpD